MLPPSVQYENNIWNVYPDRSGAFLVVGTEKALLVDSGRDYQEDMPEAIRRITSLPVEVVNTHSHADHTGCNAHFDRCYISSREIQELPENLRAKAVPVDEGYTFDLGGRLLEVIAIPGHTPGSIGILERATGCLFAGDMVKAGAVFYIKESCGTNLDDYEKSMQRLVDIPEIRKIYVSHGEFEVGRDVLEKVLGAVQGFKNGTLKKEPFAYAHFTGWQYLTEEGYGFLVPD